MSQQYLSEIRIVSFNYPPKGWAFCNGQTLPINQYQALFSLIGTYYGGDGITNFKLPNLQARMPVHQGPNYVIGQAAGESAHTLITQEMPGHQHQAQGVSGNATSDVATNNTWAVASQNLYAATPNTTLLPTTLGSNGGSQPHNNMPPYLVLNFVIALVGIYPSRN
jgi:microcystin-dependent protein